MEENQIQENAEVTATQEPTTNAENSVTQNSAKSISTQEEGQATAPSELILGKFKSLDDLSKAYQALEKHQGYQSQELGALRQNTSMIKNITSAWKREDEMRRAEKELREATDKYNTPHYFQDPSFREIYREAYLALGKNLDMEKLVNLIEGYVSSRIFTHEQERSAKLETENVLNSMSFDKNSSSSITPPKKRLDEMTPKEVDELLERLI